ncbi:tyrosine-type recombinase/integrase, partial [Mycobacterium sp. SM3041]|uniref:tyrosine-type recombinase/integrase n=1 Tax=Mycobacterium sp. SM3041 TaxID=3114291 RepID=UPI00320470FB
MASIKKYPTKKGELWLVQYRTPEGRVTKRRGFATKRQAEDFAATTHVSKLRGEYIDPNAAKVTIGELGPEWLASRTHLKPSSARVEESAWKVHVEPRWGKTKLASLKHSAVKSWVADMTKAGSGPVTVTRAYNTLAGILDEAVKDRRLLTNPARGVKLPRKVKAEHAYLTESQVITFATEAGPDKGVIVLLLAYTGLRWGELAGLHVADIDMLRRKIHVRRNAVNVGGRVVVGTPKTHERRTITLPKFLVELLAPTCQGKGRDSIVFGTDNGTYPMS